MNLDTMTYKQLKAYILELEAQLSTLRADAALGAMVRQMFPDIETTPIKREAFFDAVRNDTLISDEDRAYWLSFEARAYVEADEASGDQP